jgi:hypothetical protein
MTTDIQPIAPAYATEYAKEAVLKSNGIVPGTFLQMEVPGKGALTDDGKGHLFDPEGNCVGTIDYNTGSIQMGKPM